ncbi:hypothetical protein AGR4A_Lc10109 [Agrobacterium tumefaciens str. B6]|uniref:Uncharacterized protein n=1 Tax=Agrobacterium tumefaciens str. B6 TaxID=1183423 RepID=A0A822V4Q0_AGRTU|nr:hypothetical protein AGR4A_Lc10109 [Agrobacterium tumefaciens str. B6]
MMVSSGTFGGEALDWSKGYGGEAEPASIQRSSSYSGRCWRRDKRREASAQRQCLPGRQGVGA